jgi:hypothetical protein
MPNNFASRFVVGLFEPFALLISSLELLISPQSSFFRRFDGLDLAKNNKF